MKKTSYYLRTNSICGTTHAMAPEFFNEPEPLYGYEVDHYAFGILIFELIIGYQKYKSN